MAPQRTTVQITMPAMGESVTEGVVLEWLKQVGDRVDVDDPLVEVSTDKVDAEVPSPAAGVLTSVAVQADETVAVGAVLGEIEVGAEGGETTPAGDGETPAAQVNGAAATDAPAPDGGARSAAGQAPAAVTPNGADNATPVAARMAADLGVDVSAVEGSGPRGRIVKDDVLRAAASAVKGAPAAPTLAPPPPEGADIKQIRGPAATLVRFMDESRSIPTATSFRTLAVDALARRRGALKAAGKRLSFTHLIAWAIVRATDDMPVMAHSFREVDGKPHRVTPDAVNLGLAVDVERKDGARSLVVPVLHGASRLSFPDFVAAYDEAVAGARDNTLAPDAYQGAQITLTNPGGIGTVASVPRLMPGQGTIVATGAIGYPPGLAQANPRQLAELGVAKVMTMTSTYDHRVIQGAESGRFLARVDELLQGADGFYDSLFAALGVDIAKPEEGPPTPTVTSADPVPATTTPAVSGVPDEALMQAVQAATSVIKAHRVHGHLAAHLDPLGSPPRGDPALDPASVNLTEDLMERIPASVLRVAVPGRSFADALPHLRDTYTGTIAYEVEHIAGHNRRVWLRENIESGAHRTPLEPERRRDLLQRLSQTEALESYLHKAFLGKKQFSVEGLDMLVPMLDETIELCADSGAREAVIGMAHRGRLNVLAHTVNQPYGSILVEFEGEQTLSADTAAPEGGTGDVKYHYGASGTYKTRAGKGVKV
ncbi:MAG: 2-oxo acid dehydrogenase subunit E2, partial [Thermoleophilaceae bacterium]